MKNPHIILQDGKIWAFEPPEKPASPTIGQSVEYERAHYLALEQKIEIINPSEIGPFLLQENEPIKWEGTVEIKYVNSNDYLANAQKKVAVLIAPVKEENEDHLMKKAGLFDTVPSEQEKQEAMWEEIKSKTEALVYAETDASQLEAEAIAISLCNAFKDKITITRK